MCDEKDYARLADAIRVHMTLVQALFEETSVGVNQASRSTIGATLASGSVLQNLLDKAPTLITQFDEIQSEHMLKNPKYLQLTS